MKDHLYIYGSSIFHVKIDIGPKHFFSQKRDIKSIGIKPCKIATF